MNLTIPFRSAALFLASTAVLFADVKLPSLFGDHMVLQEQARIPFWGTADPGETVTVQVGGETGKTAADAQGKWRVDLAPLPAQSGPVSVTVTGKNSITFSDVFLGEVWVCSGQSNMEYNLGAAKLGGYGSGGVHDAAAALPNATDPQLRLFLVGGKVSFDPLDDVSAAGRNPGAALGTAVGKWQLCSPETAAGFSAVAYYFGSDLRHVLNKPVGLIGSYFGGTPAQSWTSLSGLQKDPAVKHYADDFTALKTAFPQASIDYPAKLEAYKAALKTWEQNGGVAYEDALKSWNATAAAAQPATRLPPKPRAPQSMPVPPRSPAGSPQIPTMLFNGMIAPLIPFGIKGVIWYQGESNQGHAAEYHPLFASLITDWREKWGEGDFPFLFVQLAGLEHGGMPWAYLRESQFKTLSLPNTGMATAVDIGDPLNVHPFDKQDVGNRLALVAERLVYGQNVIDSGPVYDSMKSQGAAISLNFTHSDGGLIIGKAPWVAAGFAPRPTDKLLGFTIAGADKKFLPADAAIQGNSVIVSSAEVPTPVAVRYDWAASPDGNLYNKAMLPALPFRTDDWPDPKAEGLLVPAAKSTAP